MSSQRPIISSRPINLSDDNFLYNLYASGRTDELAPLLWSSEQKEFFLQSQYQARKLHYENNFHNSVHQIVILDDENVGMIHYCEKEDEIRLMDIVILAKYQNRGIATILLEELIGFAKKCNKPLFLSVLKHNPNAFRLYERLGFLVVSEDDMYKVMQLNE